VGGFNSATFVDQEARFALKFTLKIPQTILGERPRRCVSNPYESDVIVTLTRATVQNS
jgi:hypothetical protein